MDMTAHEEWFREFVRQKRMKFSGDASPIDLKLIHTINVLQNASRIMREEEFDSFLYRAGSLGALYHDMARFDQYLEYGTFKDADSRNHGLWAAQLVKRERRFESETPRVRQLAMLSICLHNRLHLPDKLTKEQYAVCNVVRDADKLDILRVMNEHLSAPGPYNPTIVLSLPDDPDLYSEAVIQSALQKRSASYSDLASVNDFRLLLGTWFYAMNFSGSRKLFRDSGHIFALLEALPASGPYAKAREHVLKDLWKAE